MPAYLSPICSSFAVCITAIKFVVPAWRLRYETRSSKLIGDSNSTNNLWLDTGMSAFFVILSLLLLVFSFVGPEEKGLQILLSLAGGSFVVYHGIYLPVFYTNWLHWPHWPRWLRCLQWLRWAPLTFFFVTAAISMLISSIFGYTEALKITLLSVLLAEYLGIFIAYLVRLRGLSSRIYSVILWSTMLCCVAWVGAFASLVCFLTGRVDFITSLWIDNAAAMVWVMWLLWNQWKGLQRAQSPKEGSGREDPRSLHEELGVLQSDLLRQDSMTQLVAPSAVHVHDSNRKG